MDTLSAIASVAGFIAIIVGAIKLTQHWQFLDTQQRDAEAWRYLTWESSELIEHHNKLIGLIASGDRKAQYFRSIEAIKLALNMRQRFTSSLEEKPPLLSL